MSSIFQFYNIDTDLYDLLVYNLLESDWKINERPRMNSIRLAALLGHEKVLDWMLQSNKYGNINESDNRGIMVLMWASEFWLRDHSKDATR